MKGTKNWRDVPKPERVEKLEVDHRGYPIFFTVHQDDDGRPNFRVIDLARIIQCAREHLCGICGEKLGYWIVLIGGPLAVKNRAFGDAPMHYECANYARQVCPYLSISTMGHKYDPANYDNPTLTVDHNVITKRPDRMAFFVTRGFRLERTGEYTVIFRGQKAKRIEWFDKEGNPIGEDEDAG